MPQVKFVRVGGRLGPAGWLLVFLAVALAAGIAIAIAILALGLFLIVAPVLIVTAAAYYLYRKIWPRPSAGPPDIVEGEYRIVDAERIERESGDRHPPRAE